MQKNKLNKQTVLAVAHNIIIDSVLKCAWDFVTSLAPTNEFEYAYTNTATEDYCDTSWHVVQNVKLYESLDYIDTVDMYNNATQLFSNFVETNLANVTVEEVYATLDNISGDTAMRDNYYAHLRSHFKQFVQNNPLFALEETEYDYCYKLVSKHTYADKVALVNNYLSKYNAVDYIQLNNTIDS
jgi:hypothetical protein